MNYTPLKGLAAFKEGQLLVRVYGAHSEADVEKMAALKNEYYVVQEVQQDKIIFRKAFTRHNGDIRYTVEEVPIKTLFTECCWYTGK